MLHHQKRLRHIENKKREILIQRYQRFTRYLAIKEREKKEIERLDYLIRIIEEMGKNKLFRKEMLNIAQQQIDKWRNLLVDDFYINFWEHNIFNIKVEMIINHKMKRQLAQTHPFVINKKEFEEWKNK